MIEIEMHVFTFDSNRVLTDSGTTYDISDALLFDVITIDRRIELGDIFEFSYSNVDLNFYNDGRAAFDFFDQSEGFGFDKVIGILIKKGIVNKFWGFVDPTSFEKDEFNNTFVFTIVDWRKWIENNLKSVALAEIADTISLQKVLEDNFLNTGVINSVSIKLGDIDITGLDLDHYKFLAHSGFSKSDLLIEMQRFYGAAAYVNADKELVFINRGMQINETAIDISDYIIQSIDESVQKRSHTEVVLSEYNAVLINTGSAGFISLNGGNVLFEYLILINIDQATNNVKIFNVADDLSNLPPDIKYLDTRSKFQPSDPTAFLAGYIKDLDGNTITFYAPGNTEPLGLDPPMGLTSGSLSPAVIGCRLLATGNHFGTVIAYDASDEDNNTITVNGWENGAPANDPSVSFGVSKPTWSVRTGLPYFFPGLSDLEDILLRFATVLMNVKKRNLSVHRADLELMQLVEVDNDNYMITQITEHLMANTDATEADYMELELNTIPDYSELLPV